MTAVTTDFTVGGASAVPSHLSQGKVTVMQYTLDTSVNNLTDDTVHAIFLVPKGCFIDCVLVDQVTPEGATMTVDIGVFTGATSAYTAVDADGFGDGLDLNAAAGTTYNSKQLVSVADTGVAAQVPALYCGYLMKLDGFIGLTNNDAADAFVARITAVIFDVNAVA